ncbi:transcription factor Dp-2 [Vipera latastei]
MKEIQMHPNREASSNFWNKQRKRKFSCKNFCCRFEYLFSFEDTFEIHDDNEVLKQIRKSLSLEAGKCSSERLKTAKSLVPKALENYVAEA